jgi:hypothetical protein
VARGSKGGRYGGGAALLLVVAVLLGGCGGGGSSATAAAVPTAKELTECVVEGEGGRGAEAPVTPKAFPTHAVELAPLTGQEGDDVVVYLSARPVFDRQLAHGFETIHEFPSAEILRGGRALLLYLPKYFSQAERELIVGCVGA